MKEKMKQAEKQKKDKIQRPDPCLLKFKQNKAQENVPSPYVIRMNFTW